MGLLQITEIWEANACMYRGTYNAPQILLLPCILILQCSATFSSNFHTSVAKH